jgi:hypothetical protein
MSWRFELRIRPACREAFSRAREYSARVDV